MRVLKSPAATVSATFTAWVFRDRGASFDREPFEIE